MSSVKNQEIFDSAEEEKSVKIFEEEIPTSLENNKIEEVLQEKIIEDDDFGDFEEASTSITLTETNDNDENNITGTCNQFDKPSCSKFDSNNIQFPLLNEILNDVNLWVIDESSSNNYLENSESLLDIFSKLYLYDKNVENEDLKGFEESLKLWNRLCFIEETNALKFLWNKSIAFPLLLKSIKINPNKITFLPNTNKLLTNSQSVNFVPTDVLSNNYSLTTSSTSHNSILSNNLNNNVKINVNKDNLTTIDSLCVPPVNFDWQSSGLSNPLTGASMSAISAVLECDFFNLKNKGASNSITILENDLKALGLMSNEECSNKIPMDILNNLLSKKSNGIENKTQTLANLVENIKYVPVEELNEEDRNIYEKIPDLTFMLNSQLVFPQINNSE